jgi:hypothetical protein
MALLPLLVLEPLELASALCSSQCNVVAEVPGYAISATFGSPKSGGTTAGGFDTVNGIFLGTDGATNNFNNQGQGLLATAMFLPFPLLAREFEQ